MINSTSVEGWRELGSRPRKVGTLKEQLFIGFPWNLASLLKVAISPNSNTPLFSVFISLSRTNSPRFCFILQCTPNCGPLEVGGWGDVKKLFHNKAHCVLPNKGSICYFPTKWPIKWRVSVLAIVDMVHLFLKKPNLVSVHMFLQS